MLKPGPRYSQETAYYDLILEKYKEKCGTNQTIDMDCIDTFVYHELRALMKDIAVDNPEHQNQMEEIAKNAIILILSLFQCKEEGFGFKSYECLTDYEKEMVKLQQIPLIS
jgi:hypothetical protein